MTSKSRGSSKCQLIKQEEVARGNWLSLNKLHYKDPTGKERIWEAVYRTTKNTNTADAVVILPLLRRILKFDCVVLVKQYRPPMNNYTLEFPAGLIDNAETPEQCALRELKEETGFIGKCKHTSPITCLDPGVGNTSITMVTVEIDGDIKENDDVKPNLEESEFIDVITVPLNQLLTKLNDYSKSGLIIDSRVYTYAIAQEQTRHQKPMNPDQEQIESTTSSEYLK